MRFQPILEIMLRKAMLANSPRAGSHDAALPDLLSDDELAIFAGQTRLVSPEKPFPSLDATPRSLSLKLGIPGQLGDYCQLGSSSAMHHPLLPGEPLSNKPGFLPDNYLDNAQATFSDLSGGWDGLFHEIPQPLYTLSPTRSSSSDAVHSSGEDTMLDDRWASFVHNYSILSEPSSSQR